jgi:hypothetical protein
LRATSSSSGNFGAARFLLDRLDPKPRGRPVGLDFAPGASLLERFEALSQALAAGEITPEEARTVALVLDLEGRERARCVAADESVMRHRDKLSKAEFDAALDRLDVLFPLDLDDEEEPEPEPDLHPAFAGSAGFGSASRASEGCRAEAHGAEAGASAADSGSASPTRDEPDAAAAPLHSASISDPAAALPTPRRRAVNRLRAAATSARQAR